MLRRLPLPLLIPLALASLAACRALSRDYPELRSYVVSAERPPAPGAPPFTPRPAAHTLEVRRMRVSPRYDARAFVYRLGEHAWESDFYHEFFTPPADLLTEATRRWLERSGLFAHVLGPASRAFGELVLEGVVTALYGDYSDPALPRAVIELQFLLLDDAAGAVLLERTERRTVELEGREPEDLVAGWNAGLAGVLAALEEALARALEEPRGAERGRAPQEAAPQPAPGRRGPAEGAAGLKGE